MAENDDLDKDSQPITIEPGAEGDVFTKEEWQDIQDTQPSQWQVMKEVSNKRKRKHAFIFIFNTESYTYSQIYSQLLGVNIFTYILALLILIFGGLNLTLGPGWLGGTLGVPGTGEIVTPSPSFPDTMDLNTEEFRL